MSELGVEHAHKRSCFVPGVQRTSPLTWSPETKTFGVVRSVGVHGAERGLWLRGHPLFAICSAGGRSSWRTSFEDLKDLVFNPEFESQYGD